VIIDLTETIDLLGGLLGFGGGGGGDAGFLGVFADETALNTAHPPGDTVEGSTATVTSPNGNLYFLSSVPAWQDTGTGFLGDMLKAVYDPTNVSGDAFSMGNMAETAAAKILTNLERAEIAANTLKVSNVTTDLSIGAKTATTLVVESSDGTDATLPQATTVEAGLMSAAGKTKLDGLQQGDITIFSEYKPGTTSGPTTTATTSGTAPTLAEMTHTFTPDDADNEVEVFFSGSFNNTAKKKDHSAICGIFIDGTLAAETVRRTNVAVDEENDGSLSTFWNGKLTAAPHTVDVRFWGSDDETEAITIERNFFIKEINEP
jgi:hypothetical protein